MNYQMTTNSLRLLVALPDAEGAIQGSVAVLQRTDELKGCAARPATVCDPPLLHIHAAELPGWDVWVLGDRQGLRLLRDAIDQALASPDGYAESQQLLVAADDEPYKVAIRCLDEPCAWERAALPYIDQMQPRGDDVVWPWERAMPKRRC